ncbi:MAG: Hpt domain-containing protein [Uliginosibacterium sp.]|nr:Hpt domain-containing protein [Uliginosibacterium sp.]
MDANLSFDKIWMLEQIGGDLDLLHEVAKIFLQDSTRLKNELTQALAAGNSKALHAAAHATKSAVGNFGALQAVDVATKLEKACKDGDQSSFARLQAMLVTEVDRLVDALQAELAEAGKS